MFEFNVHPMLILKLGKIYRTRMKFLEIGKSKLKLKFSKLNYSYLLIGDYHW